MQPERPVAERPTSWTFVDNTVELYVPYHYRVVSTDAAGTPSPPSDAISARAFDAGPPSEPTFTRGERVKLNANGEEFPFSDTRPGLVPAVALAVRTAQKGEQVAFQRATTGAFRAIGPWITQGPARSINRAVHLRVLRSRGQPRHLEQIPHQAAKRFGPRAGLVGDPRGSSAVRMQMSSCRRPEAARARARARAVGYALAIWAAASGLAAAEVGAAPEVRDICQGLRREPGVADRWLDAAGALLSGRALPCMDVVAANAKRHRQAGAETRLWNPATATAIDDDFLINAAVVEALALSWAGPVRARGFRLLATSLRPRLAPCRPVDNPKRDPKCLAPKGDRQAWMLMTLLAAAEDRSITPATITAQLGRLPPSQEKPMPLVGVATDEPCRPSDAGRARVEPPGGAKICNEHGYRVCPVRPEARWVHLAAGGCEHDRPPQVRYQRESPDRPPDVWITIPFDSYDENDQPPQWASRYSTLFVVDGQEGILRLMGDVAVRARTTIDPTVRELGVEVRRLGAGRLSVRRTSATTASKDDELLLRRARPMLLAPGEYQLVDGYFRREPK